MDRKNALFILGIIFAVVFALSLKGPRTVRNPYDNVASNTCDKTSTTTDCDKISLPSQSFGPQPVVYENKNSRPSLLQSQEINNWNIFKNTKYHYLISYPLTASISSPNNDYAVELNEEKSLDFFISGKTKLVGVDVEIIEPWQEEYYKTKILDSEKKIFEKNKKIISLDLKSYAETIRNLQVNDKDAYIKDREKVGDMQEILFANTKAYRFTLIKGFESLSGGYTLPSGVFTYLITENPVGQKMIIHYLSNDKISEKMVQSFQFIK